MELLGKDRHSLSKCPRFLPRPSSSERKKKREIPVWYSQGNLWGGTVNQERLPFYRSEAHGFYCFLQLVHRSIALDESLSRSQVYLYCGDSLHTGESLFSRCLTMVAVHALYLQLYVLFHRSRMLLGGSIMAEPFLPQGLDEQGVGKQEAEDDAASPCQRTCTTLLAGPCQDEVSCPPFSR